MEPNILSDMAKLLHGEGSQEYHRQFKDWRDTLKAGGILSIIAQLKQLRDKYEGKKRDVIQKLLNYLDNHKDRMNYDKYIAMKLPTGSGTIESSCKNVTGNRLKQGGMKRSVKNAAEMMNK